MNNEEKSSEKQLSMFEWEEYSSYSDEYYLKMAKKEAKSEKEFQQWWGKFSSIEIHIPTGWEPKDDH